MNKDLSHKEDFPEDDFQKIVNDLSYIKPIPPPPIRMRAEDYVTLLNKLKPDQKMQKAVLDRLEKFKADYLTLLDELENDLHTIAKF